MYAQMVRFGKENEMHGKPFYAYMLFLILPFGISHGATNVLTNPGFESGTTGWVRISSTTSATVQVTFEKQDDNSTSYYNVATTSATNSGWVQLSGNYTLNVTGTLTVPDVYFEGPGSGVDIYVDDANVYGPESNPANPNATGNVNVNVHYQVLEGFGAAGAWYEGWLTAHPLRETLYNLLFDQLGLDIYRVRNTYNYDSGYMSRTKTIVTEALERNPNLKILISSWSPPAYLKSNGSTTGGGNATLDGGPSAYVYSDFADWWADSITAWSGYGVDADYISIQNEPDYDASWDSCRFNPTQNSSVAGYNQAFETVYNEMYSRFGSSMPKMIGPESAGLSLRSTGNYISALINQSHIYGYAHHLYGPSNGDNPDGYLTAMTNFAATYGSKPLFQTEYSYNNTTFTDAMNLAILMHNSLTVEGVASYIYWDLYWASPGGLVSFPSYGSSSYTINPVYYAFKHYSAFTDPNWQRVDASTDSSCLRISAYISPSNNQVSVVIINTSTDTNIELDLSFTGFTVTGGDIYRSSQSENCVLVGSFNTANSLTLPANSITTLSLFSGTGVVLCEWWTDITGTEVNALTSDVNYPDNSTGRELLTKLEGPTNWADNYGTRIRGYLNPLTSGNYRFWIASNDNSELWLSTNDDPCNATRIAYAQGYTNARQWDKYTTQKSSLISLLAGQKYYIEVLHKEGSGDDNIAVAWQGPGISQQVINSIYLSPCCLEFADFAGLTTQWNRNDCNSGNDWCYGFDFNRDGAVLFDDLEAFIDGWLIGIE